MTTKQKTTAKARETTSSRIWEPPILSKGGKNMIQMVKGTYGRMANGRVEPMTKNSGPFSR